MADLKISDFDDGGTIQYTDEIAAVRGGVNTKVFVGTAATFDVGTGGGEIPTNSMIPGTLVDSFYGTSVTSNTIGTGSKSFVTETGKAFAAGRFVLIVDAADPTVNQMSGMITDYDTLTGDLDVNVTSTAGSGTIDDWIIYISGTAGMNGDDGDNGWSPVLAIASDGARRVLQVVDWVGGEGTKPATGDYVAATGLDSDIADAVDIRGPQGAAGSGDAIDISYDNTDSALSATNVQDAIDEIVLEEVYQFRRIPFNRQNNNYTFLATDVGGAVGRINGDTGSVTYTIDADVIPDGGAVVILNDGTSGNISLTASVGTLVWNPTRATGNRTLAPGAQATIYKHHTDNRIQLTGVGIT